MSDDRVMELERKIGELTAERASLRRLSAGTPVPSYTFAAQSGGAILRMNSCVFGPGDLYCAMWSLLGLAGIGVAHWTPQFNYWRRPAQLDDGGDNVPD